MTDQNQLVQIVEQSNLPKPKVQTLMETFAPAFQEAKQIVTAAREIKVTSADDTDTMQLARTERLKLKDIRVSIEKTRKELKEQSLREGRAIDGAANIIKALIVPVEEHLQAQEKYAELLEEKRLAERHQKRLNDLTPYVEDVSVYELKGMSDVAFDNLLKNSKEAHEARIAAEKKAEAERLENQRKEKIYNERRVELAPYTDFISFDFELTLETTAEAYSVALASGKKNKKKHDDEQERIRQENLKLAKEKEAAEQKLREQQEAQAKKEADAKARVEAEQKAKEKAEREAMLLPDANKLYQLAADIEVVKLPAVKSNEAQKLVNETERRLKQLAIWLHGETQKL
jgi:colicin import membrane protein